MPTLPPISLEPDRPADVERGRDAIADHVATDDNEATDDRDETTGRSGTDAPTPGEATDDDVRRAVEAVEHEPAPQADGGLLSAGGQSSDSL